MSVRNGAARMGRLTIRATSQADMPNSTIITRLSVPTNKAPAIPTET